MGLKLWLTVIITIAVTPFFWYVAHSIFLPYQTAGSQLIQNLGTNSTISDSIELFFSGVDTYILVIFLIALAYYAWQYSQKRGVPVYE